MDHPAYEQPGLAGGATNRRARAKGANMRIVIVGGAGQLGRAIARRAEAIAPEARVVALGREQVDVASLDAVAALQALRPDVVVNAAAMTDVDGCERDPDAAFRANALGARNVALGAERAGAALVQVSTDYVFDGAKGAPYWEFDAPSPISAYGASKLAGEDLARQGCSRTFVVRTAWLYGLGGRSFVTRIVELAAERDELSVVDNEVGNPTFCDDLADALLALVSTGAFGTYHLVNRGHCSRFALARAVLDRAGRPGFPLRAVDHFPRAARPPAFAPLRNFAAAELGIDLPAWEDGLDRFVARGGLAKVAAAAVAPGVGAG